MNINYNLGLDIGTNSVGWCVTDTNGRLLKKKHRNLWGVRLFEGAETAKECRIKRNARRRYLRRRTRILKLREIFSEEILKVDENFYARLDEAFLWKEDRTLKNQFILFNSKEYSDIQHFRYDQNPTIYHLRARLLESKQKEDIRFIYLALHHMMKYRGHFLFQGQKLTAIESIRNEIDALIGKMEESCGLKVNDQLTVDLEHELAEEKSKKEKQESIEQLLTGNNLDKKKAKDFAAAMLGYTFTVKNILGIDILASDDKPLKASFSDEKYEEVEEIIRNSCGEEFEIIELLNKVYSWLIYKEILRKKKYLSLAMKEKYEIHREQLKLLKKLIKKYYPLGNEYKEFFHEEKKEGKKYVANYANYIKGSDRCKTKDNNPKENLYITIHKLLDKKAKDDAEYKVILAAMEEKKFLCKINEVNNSKIPYQLNEIEMERILDTQGEFYPVLKENKELLLKIFNSRIPYYVGPLNAHGGERNFSWLIKKSGMKEEKLYPWNVEDVIDIDATAEQFITRMTNFCTYLTQEKVLPKCSLLYQKYEVLSELSQISINGRRLGKKDRDRIISEIFKEKKVVKEEDLINWLTNERYANLKEKSDYVIKGFQADNKFATSMSSYISFCKILGNVDESNESMIEEIIYWLTIFDEKSIIKRKIKQKYGNRISDVQLEKIIKIKVSGWGRLSRKFLNGIRGDKDTTIIEMLENHDERFKYLPNLMQIINRDEKIKKTIEDNRIKYSGDENLSDIIDNLCTSPANKRGIKQCMKVVDELIEIMGEYPNQIFIEFARDEDEKIRTKSREDKLKKAFADLKKMTDEYNKRVEGEFKNNTSRLVEEKVYLYFMQNGKDLYTGKELDFNKLSEYEVDHIIPRSLTDDDSLDNKALVHKGTNQEKCNYLLCDCNIQVKKDRRAYWDALVKAKLITDKKLSNLLTSSIEEVLTRGFINRQLVETRQIVKITANLIRDYYKCKGKEIEVIEIKSDLNTCIRNKYTREKLDEQGYYIRNTSGNMLFKNRNVNDFHHANDAYLSVIVGLYIQKAFPTWKKELNYFEYKKLYKAYYETRKNERFSVKNCFHAILGHFDEEIIDHNTGELIWNGKQAIAYINKIFCYRDYFVSRKLEEGTGAFYNETRYPKNDAGNGKYVAMKKGLDPKKYGGYKGGEKAYFTLVKYEVKKKKKLELVEIPVYVAKDVEQGGIALRDYIMEQLNVEAVEILRDKICKYQKIEDQNGNLYYLTSASETINAKQLVLGGKNAKFNRLISYLNGEEWKKINPEEYDEIDELYAFLCCKIKEQFKAFSLNVEKLENADVYNELKEFGDKVYFVRELLKFTRANAEYPNLKKITQHCSKTFVDRYGRKNSFSVGEKITLYHTSVTGVYERSFCYELEDGCNSKSHKA